MRSQYVTFRVGPQLVGVDILLVREINRALPVTPVALAADHVIGLVNLRGQVVTVFDLGRRLGFTPVAGPTDPHDVILRTSGELATLRARHARPDLDSGEDLLGLRVDSIAEIVEAKATAIEPLVANLGHLDRSLLAGVLSLDEELLLLLDVRALASSA